LLAANLLACNLLAFKWPGIQMAWHSNGLAFKLPCRDRWDRASLDETSFDRASLDEASLDEASLDEASLDRASLDEASLDRVSLGRASLGRASLGRASIPVPVGLNAVGSSMVHYGI
jgi:uncharacterized protein YjbI with pentapeptide repeats